ncbi:Uncharacterised protein [Chlamydia abortus]|nr:Uncharacterised protein [Chlamydia abortus]
MHRGAPGAAERVSQGISPHTDGAGQQKSSRHTQRSHPRPRQLGTACLQGTAAGPPGGRHGGQHPAALQLQLPGESS